MSEPAARFGIENLPATPEVGSTEADLERARRIEAQDTKASACAENVRLREALEQKLVERHPAERLLQESKEYCDSIIETIPSSLLTIDQQLRVVSANRDFLQEARRSESETIGRRIEKVFSRAGLAYSKLEERINRGLSDGRALQRRADRGAPRSSRQSVPLSAQPLEG